LGYFKGPVNVMLSIKQDLWFHNWDQPVVLITHETMIF
jgi:hypothetical protein